MGFNRIPGGETEEDVQKLLGYPRKIEPCGEFFGPIDEGEKQDCTKEYLYASPFSPLLPRYYVVRFNGQDRVIGSNAYSSP